VLLDVRPEVKPPMVDTRLTLTQARDARDEMRPPGEVEMRRAGRHLMCEPSDGEPGQEHEALGARAITHGQATRRYRFDSRTLVLLWSALLQLETRRQSRQQLVKARVEPRPPHPHTTRRWGVRIAQQGYDVSAAARRVTHRHKFVKPSRQIVSTSSTVGRRAPFASARGMAARTRAR